MRSEAFLKCVGEAYAAHYRTLDRILFVFPSKRSGSFFLDKLAKMNQTPILAPQVTTIADFLTLASGREMDNRLDLLFTLYDAYRNIAGKEENKGWKIEDFNNFRIWGDVIISDFSAVDMAGVDAAQIFKNVKDHHEIQSAFLTDAQREVLRDYFNIEYSEHKSESLWLSMEYESETGSKDAKINVQRKRQTEVREHFRRLWSILWPLYQEFNRLLDLRGLSYAGKTYKLAFQHIKDGYRPDADKIVFVGFNVLTTMEWLIFDELQKQKTIIDGLGENLADFIWDGTGPLLGADAQVIDETQSAVRYITKNRKNFPEPQWAQPYLRKADAKEFPEVMEIHASPSDAMQAKIAGEILDDIHASLGQRSFDEAKVAMVLPDEGLLLPTLYSIPDSIDKINLTMGYPIKLTSTISFIERLRFLQSRQRLIGDEVAFFHEDIELLLGHPFAQKIISSASARRIKAHIAANKKYAVTIAELNRLAPDCDYLWKPVHHAEANDAIEYLDEIMGRLYKKLFAGIQKPDQDTPQDSPEMAKYQRLIHNARLESAHISTYRDALRRLQEAIREHNLELEGAAVFPMADKLIAAERVNFVGEPFEGLQIMGLLETRCLDFDALVIPSMNEKIFPMRMRSKTFIPDNLRHAYCMPSSKYEEAVFAYYFYRLISRADKVYMIYDARVGGLKSGDLSRYVLQLKHLYARNRIVRVEHSYTLTSPVLKQKSVDKKDEVKRRLDLFFTPKSGFKLSASALQKYMNCPLQFFFQHVACFNSDNEPTEFIDAATSGTIVHEAILKLYIENEEMREILLQKPIRLSVPALKGIYNDDDKIKRIVEAEIRKHYLHEKEGENKEMPRDAVLNLNFFSQQVRAIIAHDIELAKSHGDILLYGAEIEASPFFTLSDGRKVNMTFKIDRLDAFHDENNELVFRIVDYKTGAIHLKAKTFDEIFDATLSAKNIFQPLLYANLINLETRKMMTGPTIRPLRPELYHVLSMMKKDHLAKVPEIEDCKIYSHLDVVRPKDGEEYSLNERFLQRTEEVISEIFNYDIPFSRCADTKKCTFCNFRPFCNV